MPRQPPDSHDPHDPIEALYALPLEAFVEERNRLAAAIAKQGDKARASAIKALAKPSLTAWAANQVYWRDRALFDDLARAVVAARRSQGVELRGAMEARRKALAAASRRAGEILAEAGSPSSPETLRRISGSLEALTALEPSAEIQPGRLVRDLDPPGFDALTGWTPTLISGGAAKAPARVLEFKSAKPAPPAAKAESKKEEAARKAALAAARAALEAAESALKEARREAQRAEKAAAQARSRADAAEAERADLETRLAKATAAAQNAAREARELERQSGAAALAVRQAEVEAARARGKVPAE
jgi:hypothetical protein